MFGRVFILIQFLQIVQGHTPLEAGVMTMPWTLAPMVVAPLTGLFAPRIGTRLLIVTGLVFLALGAVLGRLLPLGDRAVQRDVAGVRRSPASAWAWCSRRRSTAVLANMVPNDQAKATGTNSTLREIGVALGIAVLTAVFTGAGGHPHSHRLRARGGAGRSRRGRSPRARSDYLAGAAVGNPSSRGGAGHDIRRSVRGRARPRILSVNA